MFLRFLKANAWVIAIVAILVTAALLIIDPAPPRELTLATGDPNGAYHEFGQRLATALEAEGLTVHLRPTKGSVENLALLEESTDGVTIALVQSGINQNEESVLRALGSLFYEPLWVFTRADLRLDSLRDLRGKSIAVGAEGSGTMPVTMRVLDLNGLLGGREPVNVLRIGGAEAAAALREGRVEVACFVGSPRGALIRGLLDDPTLTFQSLRRERAYQAAFPSLATLTIGEGQLDLAKNIPAGDRVMLASVVTLVVNDDFHPGMTPAVLEAAKNLLRGGGSLERPGEFPAPRPADFPLLAEASHYHRYGPPFLMRYLPFWAATVTFRVFILLVPLIAILIPVVRMAPPIYQWRTRRRIFLWYEHLRKIDERLSSGTIADTVDAELAGLHKLQDEVLKVKVPLSYSDELYDLHLHIEWVIRRLEQLKAQRE